MLKEYRGKMKSDWETRRDIVAYAKQVYDKGMVAATDGNVSYRLMTDRIMITPSGTSFATLTTDTLAYVDLDGNILNFEYKPSSELPMHLDIYKQRPDINAIIHAHPPFATALTLTGHSLTDPILPEVVMMFGKIPTAPYATPATQESANSIRYLIKDHDAILLDHHGAVTYSASLQDAFHKMEKLEHAAKTILAAKSIGTPKALDENQLSRIKELGHNSDYGKMILSALFADN
jgi:L-fuculose-phosphate aldolase